jgi:hypothetical protein
VKYNNISKNFNGWSKKNGEEKTLNWKIKQYKLSGQQSEN